MAVIMAIVTIITSYLVLVIGRWVVNRRRRHQLFKKYGIPGPEPSFLSGNFAELRKDPSPNDIITSWLKKYGDVFGYYVGDIPYMIIKDLDFLKQVLIKDFHMFCNRPAMFLDVSPLNQTIIALKDKRWKEVRSILTPTFSSGKIKLMTHIVSKKVDITVAMVTKRAENNEMFDIYELVQGLTLDIIADCALAMKTHCQENPKDIFLISVQEFFRVAHNKAVDYAIMFPFVVSIMSFIHNYMTAGQMSNIIVNNVEAAIAARRKDPHVRSIDILQMILDHQENDPKGGSCKLTDKEIVAQAYIFLLAGYETTATALAFTFYLLVKHPDVQERVYQEIVAAEVADYETIQSLQYLDQVFSESLRIYPPVTGFVSRNCSEDYQLGPFTLPKGVNVLAPVWDIHHDPNVWPDPWKFDPERFSPENKSSIHNMSYLPFGVGPRNCIGARFAALEAKMALFQLVKRFRFEACEKTDDPLPLVCPTVIINPANGVYLRAVPRDAK